MSFNIFYISCYILCRLFSWVLQGSQLLSHSAQTCYFVEQKCFFDENGTNCLKYSKKFLLIWFIWLLLVFTPFVMGDFVSICIKMTIFVKVYHFMCSNKQLSWVNRCQIIFYCPCFHWYFLIVLKGKNVIYPKITFWFAFVNNFETNYDIYLVNFLWILYITFLRPRNQYLSKLYCWVSLPLHENTYKLYFVIKRTAAHCLIFVTFFPWKCKRNVVDLLHCAFSRYSLFWAHFLCGCCNFVFCDMSSRCPRHGALFRKLFVLPCLQMRLQKNSLKMHPVPWHSFNYRWV